MKSHKTVIYTIWALIIIFMTIVIFSLARDVRKLQLDNMDVKNQLEEYKDSLAASDDRVRRVDSSAAVEINKLRENLVEVSHIKEMNVKQVKEMQVELKKEDIKRDSLGKTLLDW